jgi:hypothetical protein
MELRVVLNVFRQMYFPNSFCCLEYIDIDLGVFPDSGRNWTAFGEGFWRCIGLCAFEV